MRRPKELHSFSEPIVDGTSSSLLRRAQAADPAAWNRLVECYSGLVFGWCRSAGMTTDEARDIGQDVFLAAYRKLPDFQPRHNCGSFRGWLRAITRNKFLDYVRRIQPAVSIREIHELPPFPDDDEESLKRDLKELYQEVIRFIQSEFSTPHWQAFFSVTVEEREPAEVAKQLGMSRNAVYLACTRIRKRVKEEYGELLGPASFL